MLGSLAYIAAGNAGLKVVDMHDRKASLPWRATPRMKTSGVPVVTGTPEPGPV